MHQTSMLNEFVGRVLVYEDVGPGKIRRQRVDEACKPLAIGLVANV